MKSNWRKADAEREWLRVQYVWDLAPFGVFYATRHINDVGRVVGYSVQVNYYADGKQMTGSEWNWREIGTSADLSAAKVLAEAYAADNYKGEN